MGTAGGKWTYTRRFGLEPPAVFLASIIKLDQPLLPTYQLTLSLTIHGARPELISPLLPTYFGLFKHFKFHILRKFCSPHFALYS